MKWMKGFLINLQFFTSIPIPIQLPMGKEHLEKAIKTFPLMGLLQGGIYAGVLFGFLHWTPFSDVTTAFAVWLAMIMLTGGIHLDGWMDTSDAFFSYRDQEKRLEIMSDPRTGAFGALSVIVLLSTRFLFIFEITQMAQPISYFLIVLIPFFSRSVMGVLLLNVKSAKQGGLGSLFKQAASDKTLFFYLSYIVILLGITTIIMIDALFGVLLFLIVAAGVIAFFKKKIVNWFGGMTGDVLGASVEGTEVLLWMTLWLFHYFVMV